MTAPADCRVEYRRGYDSRDRGYTGEWVPVRGVKTLTKKKALELVEDVIRELRHGTIRVVDATGFTVNVRKCVVPGLQRPDELWPLPDPERDRLLTLVWPADPIEVRRGEDDGREDDDGQADRAAGSPLQPAQDQP